LAEKYNAEGKLPDSKKSNLTPLQKLVSKDVGYSHIKQEDIILRPYNKKSFVKVNTHKFISINQLNLFRAILMTIIIFAEMYLCYKMTSEMNYYLPRHYYFYVVFGAIGIIYLLLSCCTYGRDINKKRPIENLCIWKKLGIRVAFAILLSAFSIGFSYCIGMTEFFDINLYLCWLMPTIYAVNIIISWFIEVIILLMRLFRS